jgi:ADP-ribose pyrophosphatase YjhB (NUDIX family)
LELPDVISDLFDRYRRVEVVNVVQSLDSDQARVDDPVYGVCILVKSKDDEYVLVKHTYDLPGVMKSNWTTPCGKVEEGETFEEAAVMEVHEETGIEVRVTGLYKVFHYNHLWEGERRAEWYVIVFHGEAVYEPGHHESHEIAEMRKFRRLPDNFAGELGQHYRDLM